MALKHRRREIDLFFYYFGFCIYGIGYGQMGNIRLFGKYLLRYRTGR